MAHDWMAEGLEHYAAGEWDAAGSAFEREVREHPANAEAWYKLGNVRTEQKNDSDALHCFAHALALDPKHARSWNNRGAAEQRLGQDEQALDSYEKALAHDPRLMEPYLNLGRLHEGHGDLARAAACLRAGVERHPGHPMLAHLLAAVTRQSPERVPREHVVAFFDGFAPDFDAQLSRLHYRVPEVIAALIGPRLEEGARVLDLGCGTGLVAAALTGRRLELDGVDLSPRMLELAAARGGYARLTVGDLDEVLSAALPGHYRAVLAADVFIYVGSLAPTFRQVARVLAPGGLFAFSVERIELGGYQLNSSGRFGHSLDYVSALAREHGLIEVAALPVALERRGSCDAQVLVLERLDDDEHDDGEEEHGR